MIDGVNESEGETDGFSTCIRWDASRRGAMMLFWGKVLFTGSTAVLASILGEMGSDGWPDAG